MENNEANPPIDNAQEQLNEILFRWNHRLDLKRASDILKKRLNPKGPGLSPIAVVFSGDPDAMPQPAL